MIRSINFISNVILVYFWSHSWLFRISIQECFLKKMKKPSRIKQYKIMTSLFEQNIKFMMELGLKVLYNISLWSNNYSSGIFMFSLVWDLPTQGVVSKWSKSIQDALLCYNTKSSKKILKWILHSTLKMVWQQFWHEVLRSCLGML